LSSDHCLTPVTPRRIALTVLLAASTFLLRPLLVTAGLQAFTYLLPVLVAAYFFGSALALLAAVISLGVANLMLWQWSPQLLFTRTHAGGIVNFTLVAAVIILYTRRHERVLRSLDESLRREKAARGEAEEANRLKDQFLATLSHELRTPINVILGYLDMLLTGRAANTQRALEIAHRNAQQQARLIEDVLDASRVTAGSFRITPEEVLPVALVRDVLESVQPAIAAKGLAVELVAPDHDLVILADPHRLRQVIGNVLSNAVKFTPPDGRVSVRVVSDGSNVHIAVRDTGRGISPEFLPHVFDMFRQGDASPTREVSGIGLGLSLVKRFVELQGGEVSIASPGEHQGTTVTCRFPVHQGTTRQMVLPEHENTAV
jgi:signal transduction histidine kinase